MKVAAALLAAGWFALVVQTALGLLIPPPWCPDLGLLVVVALGLGATSTPSGAVIATLMGYGADLVSGSLFGQQAILRLLAFGSARLASRQLDLRGSLPLVVFCFAATLAYGVLLALLTRFFTGASPLAGSADWLIHAGANALCAPAIAGLVNRVESFSGGEEPARRGLRLDPRGGAA